VGLGDKDCADADEVWKPVTDGLGGWNEGMAGLGGVTEGGVCTGGFEGIGGVGKDCGAGALFESTTAKDSATSCSVHPPTLISTDLISSFVEPFFRYSSMKLTSCSCIKLFLN